MLDVRNLSASYPGGFALRDISFQICNPQMTGIIGPNGSGKSTLLKALCADLDSTGNIQLDGTDLRKARPLERARKVAVVPQSIEKIPVSVLEFVLAGRTPFKKWHQLTYSEADKVLAWEKLEEVGLLRNFDKKTLASKNMDELSGGERQLAAIAQASGLVPSSGNPPRIGAKFAKTRNPDVDGHPRHQSCLGFLLPSLMPFPRKYRGRRRDGKSH